MTDIITPLPLQTGDKIAIISPATSVNPDFVGGAAAMLLEWGFRPMVYPGALGPADGTYASSADQRFEDLQKAITDPEIKGVLCARGGYGCVHLIDKLPVELLRDNPKWIIGFSDVSALHAMMHRAGVASLHAGMAKHLTQTPTDDISVRTFLDILRGATEISYTIPVSEQTNALINGEAEGELRGGNFAVLSGLADTPFDLLSVKEGEGVILFLEDVGEAVYQTERMLYRLHLNGTLKHIKGLVMCDFNDYRKDINFGTPNAMIAHRLKQWGVDIPVVSGFPVGHIEGRNLPMVEGWQCRLSVSPHAITLKQWK